MGGGQEGDQSIVFLWLAHNCQNEIYLVGVFLSSGSNHPERSFLLSGATLWETDARRQSDAYGCNICRGPLVILSGRNKSEKGVCLRRDVLDVSTAE